LITLALASARQLLVLLLQQFAQKWCYQISITKAGTAPKTLVEIKQHNQMQHVCFFPSEWEEM